LRAAQKKDATPVIILISSYSTTEIAVEAMNEGAFDFVPKPFDNTELKSTIKKAIEFNQVGEKKTLSPTKPEHHHLHFGKVIGKPVGYSQEISVDIRIITALKLPWGSGRRV